MRLGLVFEPSRPCLMRCQCRSVVARKVDYDAKGELSVNRACVRGLAGM